MLEEYKTERLQESLEIQEPIEYDYSTENLDDEIFQDILIFCEELNDIPIDEDTKKNLEFSIYFVNEKIDYLENLQKVMGLGNNIYRLTDIAKYLDALTTQERQHNMMDDFKVKMSLMLDLLYSTHTHLSNFYQENFNIL